MKKLIVLFSLLAVNAHAGPVDDAIRNLKKSDVRTTRHVVTAQEADGVCTQAGDTVVGIEVKIATRQERNGTIATGYSWKTVKTVNISPKGEVMEICAE